MHIHNILYVLVVCVIYRSDNVPIIQVVYTYSICLVQLYMFVMFLLTKLTAGFLTITTSVRFNYYHY